MSRLFNKDSGEFDREAAERAARAQIAAYDRRRSQEAKSIFDNRIGLQEAVAREILPALVTINTQYGVIGTGFYQHSQWLVSNAHVVPAKEVLNGVQFLQQGSAQPVQLHRSYHRPSQRPEAPDVVVMNTELTTGAGQPCLRTDFNGDESHQMRLAFYIDLARDGSGQYQIKFLYPLSKPGTYPVIYQSIDGSVPEPGSSGSPIIEARVATGHSPEWQFRVVGALYARCAASWYNNNSQIRTKLVADDTKLVCAIPIKQDFNQILEILNKEAMAERQRQMSAASATFHDEKGRQDTERYKRDSQLSDAAAKIGLQKFSNGESPLNIALPDGLEKLYYSSIVAIENSLLIPKVLTSVAGGKSVVKKRFFNVPQASYAELQSDFDDFVALIREMNQVKLTEGDSVYTSPAGHFRIDIHPAAGKTYQIDIQDNTGKFFLNGKALSSVFAKAIVPQDPKHVNGKYLAQLFIQSQNAKSAQSLNDLSKEFINSCG